MSEPQNLAGQFPIEQHWRAVMDMLRAQLPGVDVQAISDSDFNAGGDLIMNPPSVRVFFDGEAAGSTSDAQRLSYNVVGRYIVSCADQDLHRDADQALASAALATRAKTILTGARIVLPCGDVTEPLTWISTAVVPVTDLGVAYALGLEVPGLAQFPGPNAAGYALAPQGEA